MQSASTENKCRSLAISQKLRRLNEGSSPEFLRIFERQEIVQVTDQDANQLIHTAKETKLTVQKIIQWTYLPSTDDHVEGNQNPGQVHGLELGPEPKLDYGVPVHLTPNVEHAQNHRL